MPSRAGHKKSRNGCIRCKQRRVKCDEQRPCRDCVRRGERCSLLSEPDYDSSFSLSPAESPMHSNQSLPNLSGSRAPGPTVSHSPESDSFSFLAQFKVENQPTAPDWSQDLFLMNHYSRSTCLSFSNDKTIQDVWQSLVPEMAAMHTFLMHGILALSAFHLSSLRPLERTKFATWATHHQGMALFYFRPILPAITQDNCKPAVCMAIIFSVIGLSTLSRPAASDSPLSDIHTHSFNDIIGVFSLTRGVKEVLTPAGQWLRTGPISVMFQNWQLDNYDLCHLPEDIQSRFDTLKHETIPSFVADAVLNLEPCLLALHQLEEIYKDVLYYPWSDTSQDHKELELGVVLKWTTSVPAKYLLLVRERNTAALIILAHFIVTIKSLGDRWFSKNWSENALQLIKDAIDPSGLPWLQWPEDQLKRQQEFWRSSMGILQRDSHQNPKSDNPPSNGFAQEKTDFAQA